HLFASLRGQAPGSLLEKGSGGEGKGRGKKERERKRVRGRKRLASASSTRRNSLVRAPQEGDLDRAGLQARGVIDAQPCRLGKDIRPHFAVVDQDVVHALARQRSR